MQIGRCSPPVMTANRASALVSIGLTIAMVGVVGGEARNDVTGAIYDVDMSAYFSATFGVWPSLRTFSGALYLVAFFAGAFGCWMRFLYRMMSKDTDLARHQYLPCTYYFAAIGDGILFMTLALIAVVSNTLPADTVFIYFVGVCYLQIFIEATRADRTTAKSSAAKPSRRQNVVWGFRIALTMLPTLLLPPISVLGTGRLRGLYDNFSSTSAIIPYMTLIPISPWSTSDVAERGQYASLFNFVACSATFFKTFDAFASTEEMKSVRLAVTTSFFVTTVVIAGISNFRLRTRRIPIHIDIPGPDKQGQDHESMDKDVRTDPLASLPTRDSTVPAH